jgi:hypothetical protein
MLAFSRHDSCPVSSFDIFAEKSYISDAIYTGKYVSEHVTELQTPAQFAQSMIDNKYPDGTTPSGVTSGYNWEDGILFFYQPLSCL